MAERTYESPVDAKRRKGVKFDMRGGPYDGMLLRLYPQPYGDGRTAIPTKITRASTDGWDFLPCEGGRYVIGEGINPLMDAKAPNKKRDNIPHMVFEAASDAVVRLDGSDLVVAEQTAIPREAA